MEFAWKAISDSCRRKILLLLKERYDTDWDFKIFSIYNASGIGSFTNP